MVETPKGAQMYSVKKLADRTGVPVHTIRAWQAETNFLGRRRRWWGDRAEMEFDAQRVSAMDALTGAGLDPHQAAHDLAFRLQAGGMPIVPPPTPKVPEDALTGLLMQHAGRLDQVGVKQSVAGAWAAYGPDDISDLWLMPMLAHLGSLWEAATISYHGEHLVSEAVVEHLDTDLVRANSAVPDTVRTVVVGVARGVRHDIGARAFAALAARSGIAVEFLDGTEPIARWFEVVDRTMSREVVLAVPLSTDVPRSDMLIAALLEPYPVFTVHVGGSAQDAIGPAVHRLGHDLRAGVAALTQWPAGPTTTLPQKAPLTGWSWHRRLTPVSEVESCP